MTKFNEMSHAFIAAKYYEYLVEKFGNRGKEAFTHGTQYYASQRGRRMAQKAIRDGKKLDYESYCQYGEWDTTEAALEAGVNNSSEMLSKGPDFTVRIFQCPWRAQFKEMGLDEGNIAYCTDLDNSIARGFNPYISYEVDLERLLDENYCIHRLKNVSIEGIDRNKLEENILGFDYHCAHSYWSYREVVTSIFGLEGEKLAIKVLEDFAEEYGDDAMNDILKHRDTNFNIIYKP